MKVQFLVEGVEIGIKERRERETVKMIDCKTG